MIAVAFNFQEATIHFFNNEGPISCTYNKKTEICMSLYEAKKFFTRKPKKIRNKVRPIK
tara:strand:- start:461 stop:637 length:177 start_codon:yes stop_codon:yes gene_type:complete